MSACIHRQMGQITHRMMCREREKLGPCPWYRAFFCIPLDVVGSVFRAIAGMLLREKE